MANIDPPSASNARPSALEIRKLWCSGVSARVAAFFAKLSLDSRGAIQMNPCTLSLVFVANTDFGPLQAANLQSFAWEDLGLTQGACDSTRKRAHRVPSQGGIKNLFFSDEFNIGNVKIVLRVAGAVMFHGTFLLSKLHE